MGRVQPGRVVDPPGRDQHAHVVRGDSRISGREANRVGVMRRGRFVVRVQRGGDGESVRDPGRRRGIPPGLTCVPEDLAGFGRLPSREGRPSRAEQRLRFHRWLIVCQISGLQEIPLGR